MPSNNAISAKSGVTGNLRSLLRPLSHTVGLASVLTGSAAAAEPAETATQNYTLPTVKVEEEAATYRSEGTTLTRAAKPLVDTPQSVTVVPEVVMREQQATSVRDALRNVSGITIAAGEGGRQGDTFILRGFSGQTDVFRDGSRDLGWFTRDTFNLEAVEVFLGPSAVLFGRGSTGGAVNLATKLPRTSAFSAFRLSGGSAPAGRLEADVNQPLGSGVSARLNAMGQMGRVAGRDGVEQNRAGVAPSVRLQLADRTALTLDYLYQLERSVPDYGQPYFAGKPVSVSLDVSRTAFYGVAGADTEDVDAHIATARMSHDFGASARLQTSARVGFVDRLARPTAPRGLAPAAQPATIGRQRFETATENTNVVAQADLRLVFATGWLQHTANVGVEVSRESRRQTRHNLDATGLASGTALPADLRAPEPSPDLSAVARRFNNDNRSTQLGAGAYLSDQVSIGRFLEVLAALRIDHFDTDYTTRNAMNQVTPLQRRDLLLNARGGLVFHPVPVASLYVMSGSSSNPSAEAGTLSDGTVKLDPERNRIVELGAKGDLLEQRLSLTGALFRVDKTNARVPNTVPDGPPQILAGEQRVQGAHLSAAGTLLGSWRLMTSYTWLRSEIREHTNRFLVGQRLPNTPTHSLALWTTITPLDRLTVGGGAFRQTSMRVNNPAMPTDWLNRVPAYVRVDAFAAYAFTAFDLQVNVNNLTNALYFEQVSGGQAVPGPVRTAMLSAAFRL